MKNFHPVLSHTQQGFQQFSKKGQKLLKSIKNNKERVFAEMK